MPKNRIEIPYSSLRSIQFENSKACLGWDNKKLFFGVVSFIRGDVDFNLTEQLVSFLSKLQSGQTALANIPSELTPKGIGGKKKTLITTALFLLLLGGVGGALLWPIFIKKPFMLVLYFVVLGIIFSIIVTLRNIEQ